jgi:hypothetical protein
LNLLVNHSGWWCFLILLVAAVVAAVWFYRVAPPAVGRRLRRVLVGLRIAALAVVIIVLLEPVIRLTRTVSERPVVAVLLDVSRSMAIPDGTGGARRGDEAVALLNEVVIPRIARDADVEVRTFSSDLEPPATSDATIVGTPLFDGDATDLAGALAAVGRSFSERNLGAVVLATDGAANRGGSPHEAGLALGVPVYALGVGSADEAPDISVREPVTNRISYSGEAIPIEARIASTGFAGAQTVVELRENGVLLDSAVVDLSGSGEEVMVSFRTVPSSPGVHTYTIAVPSTPGELLTANNSRVVSTNTFKGRIRVLLVAPRPSWEYAFMKRALSYDRNMELVSVVAMGGSRVYVPDELPESPERLFEYDLVVLVDPDWSAPLVPAEWLSRFVRERGGGLMLLGLPPSDGATGGVADLAPVVLTTAAAPLLRESRVRLTGLGQAAPATRVTRDRFENAAAWESLPPVLTAPSPWWNARPEATVLVVGQGTEGRDVPVYVGLRRGAGNVLALLAEGVWRWKMAAPEGVDAYDQIVANAARWLTARGELERVNVTTDKDVYAAGEEIRLSAQVYRSDFRLARDASVSVSVSRREGAAPLETVALTPEGDFYRAVVGPLASGGYVFRGLGRIGSEEVGEGSGEFVVEEFSLEDAEIRRRAALLRRLAAESGGRYVSPETMDELPDSVPLERRRVSIKREFELWNSPWPLILFVGLLSVEWTLRRRKGLP